MTNENTKIVVPQQTVDLTEEARKQFRIAAVNALHSAKEPAKDFTYCVIDYLFNQLIKWVDDKLSA